MNDIIVFLPMRKGSQRVKNKNIKDFANIKGGLTFLKISQLLDSKMITKIIVSTNDEEVKNIALSFNNTKITIDNRPEELATSTTSTDDLINYVPKIINSGTVLWTHVTSPFITAKVYDEIINNYFESILSGYDSLMTTTKIHGFLWDDKKALNYDRNIEKWPRTQTLEPINEINSGIFINSIDNYKNLKDRIGKKPKLVSLNKIVGFDVDWEEDFLIAESIYKSIISKKND